MLQELLALDRPRADSNLRFIRVTELTRDTISASTVRGCPQIFSIYALHELLVK